MNEEKAVIVKNRSFNWEIPFFTEMDKNTLDSGEQLYQTGCIKDVYLNNNKVSIEYYSNSVMKTIKVPLNMKTGVRFTFKNNTNKDDKNIYLVIVAAYFYHKYNQSYFDKTIDNFEYYKESEATTCESFDNVSEVTVSSLFDDDTKEEYKEIINIINEEELIPDSVKINYLELVKILINYNKMGKIGERPLINYAFMENTDTINKICLGQSKCIDILIKILVYFDVIDENNTNKKFVDFKELTENEKLIPDNYKEDIIILYNMHYLTDKLLVSGSTNQQELASIIKNNFPSFILNESQNKVFIICDKTVNVNEFFAKMQQLRLNFEFLSIPDLNIQQIHHLFLKKVTNPKYKIQLEEDFDTKFMDYLNLNYNYSPYKNLEFIEFLYLSSIKKSLKTNHPYLITINELEVFRTDANEEFNDLDSLIGLVSVKEEIRNLKAFLEFKKEKEMNGDMMPSLDLHMCFFGNPGTGKTTVARLMGGILFNLGYIRYNKCIEVEAKDLIANIEGATAMKTSEKIQEAMGGILFIDEAYAIKESAYGGECIATLIKAMEDYRDDLVVILAGYRIEMLQFLEYNSGFKSRIAYTFEFQDYSNKELLLMTEQLLKKYNFTVDSYSVLDKLSNIYTSAKKTSNNSFGNSRFVRNTVNKILRQHAINTAKEQDDFKKNRTITIDDIKDKY